jgi:hypothetical protein
MNKSQRIQLSSGTTNNDNYIKIQLEQNVDTLEFLSMSINTKDAYLNFNADYGVLVGRVIANGGIGVPNAKISIFIPLTDEDANNSEINSIYPYKTPRDKNNEGKRYNLLPRVAKIDPITQISSPKQPFGSFPIKEELVTNESYMNVYKKYYKYTALTNNSGDYMIFGVPIGTQTVHLSVDITDIGKYSMNPASMVTNLGYSPNLFTDNNSKIKPSTDLTDLPNIETQEISVDIIPFWGNTDFFEIGITRQDFRIRSVLNNTFVIFGSVFTDGDNCMWGENHFDNNQIAEMFRAKDDANTTIGMFSKRIGKVTEKIYYYPASITDDMLAINPMLEESPDPTKDMILLDPSEYSVYKREGDFAFIISCNRNKIVTDEFGVDTSISNTSPNGIFTEFKGFITLEITPETIPMNFKGTIGKTSFGGSTEVIPFRYILKFPQTSPVDQYFQKPSHGTEFRSTDIWRKEYYTFSGGTIYSVAKFHGTTFNEYNDSPLGRNERQYPLTNGFFRFTYINQIPDKDPFWNVGIIINGDYQEYENSQFEFPSNSTRTGVGKCFGANWMNLSIYLPQLGYITKGVSSIDDIRSADHFTTQNDNDLSNGYYFVDNTQKIAAGQFNTKWFARSDLNWTDFIIVSKTDILKMNNGDIKKGFTNEDISDLTGTYRNGINGLTGTHRIGIDDMTPCPFNGGKLNGNPSAAADPKTYFYKGFDAANCIDFIMSLGLV